MSFKNETTFRTWHSIDKSATLIQVLKMTISYREFQFLNRNLFSILLLINGEQLFKELRLLDENLQYKYYYYSRYSILKPK